MVLEKKLRDAAADFLPKALKMAIESYETLLPVGKDGAPVLAADKESGDAFKVYHDRGKVALAHIELLLKVAERVGMNDAGGHNDDLHELIFQAQKDVVAHYGAALEARENCDGE